MKLIKTLVVACAFSAVSAYAVDPVRSEMTCDQLSEKYAFTEEAKERFADLAGTCEGVYEIDGHLYARAEATIRNIRGRVVRLYLPATDRTFQLTAEADGRVWVGGQKMRLSDMGRGDRIGIYVSVDKFAEERVDEITFVTADEGADEVEVEVVTVTVEEVEALPTTG